MKNLLIFSALFLAFGACKKATPLTNKQLLAGTWKLEKMVCDINNNNTMDKDEIDAAIFFPQNIKTTAQHPDPSLIQAQYSTFNRTDTFVLKYDTSYLDIAYLQEDGAGYYYAMSFAIDSNKSNGTLVEGAYLYNNRCYNGYQNSYVGHWALSYQDSFFQVSGSIVSNNGALSVAQEFIGGGYFIYKLDFGTLVLKKVYSKPTQWWIYKRISSPYLPFIK